MPKLALCLITSRTDYKKAKELSDSLKSFVDEVVLTVCDKDIGTHPSDSVGAFEWIDDFSAARTFNFSQTQADWILWLDADDTLDHPEKLKDLIKEAEARNISGYFFNYQYAFDERGNCIQQHWKLQLVKNDAHFEWVGAIHEDILQKRGVNYVRQDLVQRIHHTDEQRAKESNERNLRILTRELEKKPNDPRIIFYIGREYLRVGENQKGIDFLTRYLELSGWDDERYEAHLLIGSALISTNQVDEALLTYHQAILEKEAYPDAYIQKGNCYLIKQQWNNALYNFRISLQLSSKTAVMENPMNYKRDVWAAIAVCYMQLSKLEDAKKAIVIALKPDPKNPENLDLLKFINEEIVKVETAKKYVEIAKVLKEPEKIAQLLHTVPAHLSDNEMILWLKNKHTPAKVWAPHSIAIYCGASAEKWIPDNLVNGGIGGSETAVIELSKRLTQKGWDVTVFNTCDAPPEGLEFDGVHYRNYWTFNVGDEFDVLWVWRIPELFDYELKARLKILDLHDTMTPADLTKERVNAIDKIFVKTNFHRSLFPAISDEKFVVVGNGIDLSKFENTIEPRDPYRFIYASAPNRGLDILLEMWPRIKQKLPEATLHVFYGWKTFYELEKGNPERMMWMKKIQEMMKQDGVIDHGRVDQKTLALEELKSSFWLYPTEFPEIDCITAKEMQAAGVIPITTGYAALEESQGMGYKLPGDVYDREWQEEYIKLIESAFARLKMDGPMENSFVQKFSWDNITDKWDSELTQRGEDNAFAEGV